jgi:large conductance mechanosensitive channel
MGIIKEFKDFISKGNVIDLAVGIIIGAAFGKIVASLVADVIMPPIGFILGGVNFTDLKIQIHPATVDAAGKVLKAAVTLNYGNFIQISFEFFIVAFSVFLLVKAVAILKRRQDAAEEEVATPLPPSREVELLSEIRDLLMRK